ncbi:DUF2142 domain-containing protein [Frankia sp. ACN1ag]|uniref:DUF2142 domain-containing protein n=1 Tax=Frankia sp. ACN1ag TaxID=102891 RepID=UPI0006DD1717|nr:hypothetical protein [Frankia sp. ACN1ag]KQC36694.1 hypothetical protein UK82_19865 [Frankia sp. ACN1ag]
MIFSALGLLVAVAVPPFTSADEAQHTAYALAVADGSLPVLDSPVRSRLPGMPGLPAGCRASPQQARVAVDTRADHLCGRRLRRPLTNFDLVYTANHPPLFYAVEAVPLRSGIALHHPLGGFRAARGINVALGVTALIATAALVRGVLPRQPAVAVGTAAITGVVGLFVFPSGQVYNDTMAVATITGLLAVTVAIARRGPGPRTLLALAVLGPAAAASRASGAVAVVVVVPAVGVAVAARTAGRPARRAGRGLAVAGGLAALTFAATGWFYLRNVHRYGDPTAFGRIAAMLPIRGPRPSAWQVVRDPDFWWNVYRGFFGRVSLLTGHAEKMAVGFAIVTGAGVLAAVVRVLTARISAARNPGSPESGPGSGPKPEPEPRQPGARLAGSVVWILLAAHCLVVVATLVGYAAAGGAAFTRYLLPMLPVLAFVVEVSCRALPLGRRGLPTVVLVAALALLTVLMITRELAWRNRALAPLTPVDRLRTAWAAEAPGPADLGLSGLAIFALVGGVLLAVALWRLGDPSMASGGDVGGDVGGRPPRAAEREGPPGDVTEVVRQRQDRLDVIVDGGAAQVSADR